MYAKFHHNSPLNSASFTFSEFGARHNLDQCLISLCNLLGYIWQSLCLDHVNSNRYAKFYQNIPKGSRDGASFTLNLNLGKTSTNPKCHLAISWATSCQYTNVYAKFHQNIPLSSRDRAIFNFSEFGARQSLDR